MPIDQPIPTPPRVDSRSRAANSATRPWGNQLRRFPQTLSLGSFPLPDRTETPCADLNASFSVAECLIY